MNGRSNRPNGQTKRVGYGESRFCLVAVNMAQELSFETLQLPIKVCRGMQGAE